jgi:protein-S-isoprenylcysteine O-methyltransferase Ste14
MYGLVRHPLYLCLIVYLGTTQTMYAANLAFALGATIYFVVGSWLEERRLLAERGTDYLHYRARVPFWIPFVRFPPAACCMSGFTPDGS